MMRKSPMHAMLLVAAAMGGGLGMPFFDSQGSPVSASSEPPQKALKPYDSERIEKARIRREKKLMARQEQRTAHFIRAESERIRLKHSH